MGPALTLHRARHLNRLSEQQQLLGHGRLTRIRVRNNGKGAARVDVAL